MIKQFIFIACDSCSAQLEMPACDKNFWNDTVHFATEHGWHAEHRSGCHYCPACRVPAKLARELRVTK